MALIRDEMVVLALAVDGTRITISIIKKNFTPEDRMITPVKATL